jgi:hypothetical protein
LSGKRFRSENDQTGFSWYIIYGGYLSAAINQGYDGNFYNGGCCCSKKIKKWQVTIQAYRIQFADK